MNEQVRQAIEVGLLHLNDNDISRGWHFCPDWDGMVIGPGMPEMDGCTCELPNKEQPK